ncbi:MAG TPA: ABC transporter substrate-binding protein [Gaiellaceae bacterium]|nr:ABC transporter substrate-binding protein [Gaiellaceae bacterium]
MRRPIAAVAGVASGVLALVAAGCGGGGTTSGVQGASHTLAGGKKGGTITILSNGDVDHLDPGAAYYQFTYAITYVTQRPLLAYKPNSIQPTPDLAASMPTVSNGGRTVTVHIRHGVKFSPPVNREVTSADVKYAIERGFDAAVGNGYAGAYFGVIKGAPTKIVNKVPSISGIQTPDKYTIVFQLTKPSGIFVGALQEPLTAPVPAEYARKYDKGTASSYGDHQVATGPYMVQNNAAGKITGYTPGRQIVLVRNPNWNPKTSWRPAYADKIVFKEGFDPTVGTKQILSGQADANGDFPPPAANLKQILSNPSQKSELEFTPTAGARFVALNTQKAPFTNKYVRMAVAYVLDRNAMRLTRGGAIDGKIATHFIDPSFGNSGFNQAGGYGFNPFPSANNSGDVAKAEAMLKKAGFKSGKYSGPQITQVADNTPPGSNTAAVVANSLQKIGFNVKTISVQHAAMYTRFCGVPKNAPNICPNVGWIADFHEPQADLDANFDGTNILSANNVNWSQLNDPAINKLMAKAKGELNAEKRWAEWGQIDKMITSSAAAIPWLWEASPTLYSTRVTHATELWNGGEPDVSFMSVK